MGLLRLALAAIVLWGHSSPANHTQLSLQSVETFFVISGFYMELIKNKYPNNFEFYRSRFIRIFALYYVVLIPSIAFSAYYNGNPISDDNVKNFAMIFQNLFIFGQDFLRGLYYFDGGIYFSNVANSSPLYNPFLGQAWSIATELTFYLTVPFLLKLDTKKLTLIMLGSLWFRFQFLVNYQSLNQDGWYSLFPGELCFFLMGSLACRFYQNKSYEKFLRYFEKFSLNNLYVAIIAVLFIGLIQPITVFSINNLEAVFFIPIYFPIIFALFIPFLFYISKNNKFDRYIGNLSYGVYVWHILVVDILLRTGLEKNHSWHSFQIQVLLISLALASLSYHLIEVKIDKYRYKSLKKSKNLSS